MKKELYSSKSGVARKVCDEIGWNFSISPVKAFARGGRIYVTGTLLHPQEWRRLIACDGMVIDGRRLTVTRRPKGY